MKKTIYACDKCSNEVKDKDDLWPVAILIGRPNQSIQYQPFCNFVRQKEYCRNCLAELFPGYIVSDNSPDIDMNLTEKTIGERFEDLVREICREENTPA